MEISIQNIARADLEGSPGYSYSLTIGAVAIGDCFEHDSVLFGDCEGAWFDAQGRQRIVAALGDQYSDEAIYGATADLFRFIVQALRATVSGAQKWIATAGDLDELLDILQRLKETMHAQDFANLNLANLPTFGGATPNDTTGIWSWDEDRLLVGSSVGGMTVTNR